MELEPCIHILEYWFIPLYSLFLISPKTQRLVAAVDPFNNPMLAHSAAERVRGRGPDESMEE